MNNAAKKEFFKKIQKQAKIRNSSEERREETRRKLATHKFRANVNTKTEGIER